MVLFMSRYEEELAKDYKKLIESYQAIVNSQEENLNKLTDNNSALLIMNARLLTALAELSHASNRMLTALKTIQVYGIQSDITRTNAMERFTIDVENIKADLSKLGVK